MEINENSVNRNSQSLMEQSQIVYGKAVLEYVKKNLQIDSLKEDTPSSVDDKIKLNQLVNANIRIQKSNRTDKILT